MARRSLVQRALVNTVLKAHNCQHSRHHRLQRGERRLKVWDERSAEHYCVSCALIIIQRDIEKLTALASQLRGEAPLANEVAQDGVEADDTAVESNGADVPSGDF